MFDIRQFSVKFMLYIHLRTLPLLILRHDDK